MRNIILLLCLTFAFSAQAQNRQKTAAIKQKTAVMKQKTAAMKQKPEVVKSQETEVMLETTAGNIRLRLYDETPLHRDNFVKLVNMHVYDSLLFHRVIKDFMIQCGDPKSKDAAPGGYLGEGGLDGAVEQELRLPQIYHRRGVLAAAREPDDANPYRESSRCHFYLAWGKTFTDAELDKMQLRLDTLYGYRVKLTPEMRETYKTKGGIPHLDGGYTVFGEIVEGLEVVEKIQQTATDKNDRPIEDQRIIRAYVVGEVRVKN